MCITINTFSIGVNDNTNTVTRAEFTTAIDQLSNRVAILENSIDNKITDYLSQQPMLFTAEDPIYIEKDQFNNTWVIKMRSSDLTAIVTYLGTTLGTVTGIVTGDTLTFTSDMQFDLYIANTVSVTLLLSWTGTTRQFGSRVFKSMTWQIQGGNSYNKDFNVSSSGTTWSLVETASTGGPYTWVVTCALNGYSINMT
ncbi:MAG: hypothetical protein Q4G04_06735 [bacterium]|nr:hypothetical protein [bacterium]